MKKVLGLAVVLCMLCACFAGCAGNFVDTPTEDGEGGLTYVSMRINPEIELVVNVEGTVAAVNAINADGETVLAELELVGLTPEEAGEAFTAMAIELGFIDVDAENATVYILANGENAEIVAELEEKMFNKIDKYFSEKGIYGKAAHEVVDEYEAKAAEWGVEAREAIIIARILELYPEMTVEEIIALSFKEKLELIKDDHKNNGMTSDIREAYKAEIEALKEEYAEMFEIAERLDELEDIIEDAEEEHEDRKHDKDGEDDDEETEVALTEEELEALKAEYEELSVRYEELKKEYRAAVEALKDEKRGDVEEARKAIKEKAKELRQINAEKLEKHLGDLEKKRAEIEEKINSWRDEIREELEQDDDELNENDDEHAPKDKDTTVEIPTEDTQTVEETDTTAELAA